METHDDLGAVIGSVEFDSERVIAHAVLDGRRAQRRRSLSACAGVLAIGTLVVAASLHFGGSREADGVAYAGQTTASASVEDTATPAVTPTGDGRVALPSADLTDARLASRLPVPGEAVSATAPGGYVRVERTIDPDGSGAGSVTLALEAAPPLSQEQLSGGAEKCRLVGQANGAESCKALADGWMFTFTSHPDLENASPKALDWSATVVRKDGTSVSLHVTNYVDRADPTRPTPPLEMSQIEALAQDPVWFQPAP
jgi:hypothetical protein